MDSTTYIKNVKITPKKLRFLTPAVASMSPHTAMDYLQYTPMKGARVLQKAIKSAVTAAALSLKTEPQTLAFKHLIVEEGSTLKRHRAGSRGAAKPFSKKLAHIKIILTTKQQPKVTNSREEKRMSLSEGKALPSRPEGKPKVSLQK
jgi:large subunit ribosomal protein L22